MCAERLATDVTHNSGSPLPNIHVRRCGESRLCADARDLCAGGLCSYSGRAWRLISWRARGSPKKVWVLNKAVEAAVIRRTQFKRDKAREESASRCVAQPPCHRASGAYSSRRLAVRRLRLRCRSYQGSLASLALNRSMMHHCVARACTPHMSRALILQVHM